MKTRRNFFKTVLVGLGAVGLTLKGGIASAKKLALKLDKVPALKKVGGSAKIKLAGKEILFIRHSDKDILGISPYCSHQNCPVKFNLKKARIECSCHGSKFGLDGSVINGPATKALKTYPTSLVDGRVIVKVD